jgi:hypothetical protein
LENSARAPASAAPLNIQNKIPRRYGATTRELWWQLRPVGA